MHLLGVGLGVAPQRLDFRFPWGLRDRARALEERSELLELGPMKSPARESLRVQFVDVSLPATLVGRDPFLLGLVPALGGQRGARGDDRRLGRAANLDETSRPLVSSPLPRRLHFVAEADKRVLAHERRSRRAP